MADTNEYTPKYIKRVDKYIKMCVDEIYHFHKQSGKIDGYEEKIRVNLPSVEGFAIHVKRARSTIYKWKEEQPDFAEALERIEVSQKKIVMDKGLSGHYNPVIAKLILTTNHGMREGLDITSAGKPTGAFSDEQVDRIAERITARKGVSSDTPSET